MKTISDRQSNKRMLGKLRYYFRKYLGFKNVYDL